MGSRVPSKSESVISETDTSNGLSSRLDKVRITSEAEDAENGNKAVKPVKTDGNGNKAEENKNAVDESTGTKIQEKTIVVQDKVAHKVSEVSLAHPTPRFVPVALKGFTTARM